MFEPILMSEQNYALTGKTSADAYEAEASLVRIEDRLESERTGPALRKLIARLEALSTIRVDGKSPNMRAMIELERASCGSNHSFETRVSGNYETCDASAQLASLEALHYMNTLRWLSNVITQEFSFTPDTLLEIHSRCLYGVPVHLSGVSFRGNVLNRSEKDPSYPFYMPPSPEAIPCLVDDLCTFLNAKCFSPIAQAGFAHFQFEGIKPFKRGLDRTGRAMCHAIFYSRGLSRRFIAPIGLLPAINTQYHAERLLPYDFGCDLQGQTRIAALDNWTRFCALSTQFAAKVTQNCIDALIALESDWNRRLGKVSKGSAAEELLLVLPGEPIVTAMSACGLIGKGFSATNDALNRLCKAGILQVVDSKNGGNRIFEAPEVFSILEGVEKALLAKDPVSRDSFLA